MHTPYAMKVSVQHLPQTTLYDAARLHSRRDGEPGQAQRHEERVCELAAQRGSGAARRAAERAGDARRGRQASQGQGAGLAGRSAGVRRGGRRGGWRGARQRRQVAEQAGQLQRAQQAQVAPHLLARRPGAAGCRTACARRRGTVAGTGGRGLSVTSRVCCADAASEAARARAAQRAGQRAGTHTSQAGSQYRKRQPGARLQQAAEVLRCAVLVFVLVQQPLQQHGFSVEVLACQRSLPRSFHSAQALASDYGRHTGMFM